MARGEPWTERCKPRASVRPVKSEGSDRQLLARLAEARRLTRAGHTGDALEQLAAAASLVGTEDRDAQVEIAVHRARCCLLRAETDRALSLLNAASTAECSPRLAATVWLGLGQTHLARKSREDALECFLAALAGGREAAAPEISAGALRGLAELASRAHDLKNAWGYARRAADEARAAADPLEQGRVHVSHGNLSFEHGALRAARRSYKRGIELFEQHRFDWDLADALLRLASVEGSLEQLEPDQVQEGPSTLILRAQEILRPICTLVDLERIRTAFRRFGRRSLDRPPEESLAPLAQGFSEVRRRLVGTVTQFLSEVHASAEGADARAEALRTQAEAFQRLIAREVGALANVEESLLGTVERTLRERERIRTLLELSRPLAALQDTAQVLADAARLASQLTDADRALVVERRPSGALEVAASLRVDAEDTVPLSRIERMLATGTPTLLASDDERAPSSGHAMAVPLWWEGAAVGAIYVDKAYSGGAFVLRDLEFLSIFCAHLSSILENARIKQQLDLSLRESQSTLNSISDPVVSIDAAGRLCTWNQAASIRLALGVAPEGRTRAASQPHVGDLPQLACLVEPLSRAEELEGAPVTIGDTEYLLQLRTIAGRQHVERFVATFVEMKRAQRLAQRLTGGVARFTFEDIVARSPEMVRCIELAAAAARSSANVLITGESGTGKEVLAQAIHLASSRAQGAFIGINCAAIPRELLESELFGYETGAFTGARKGGQPGKFELADGGTLLLDEIGEMPLEMQTKLLRPLQEKNLVRVGGQRSIAFNARVIAATNRELLSEIARGGFRQDLYFRLCVIHIEMPPLRAREADLDELIDRFLRALARQNGTPTLGVSPEARTALHEHDWPGNVRELQHVLEARASLLRPGEATIRDIPELKRGAALRELSRRLTQPPPPSLSPTPQPSAAAPHAPAASLDDAERQVLVRVLEETGGDILEASKRLGVSRSTIYAWMSRHRLRGSAFRRRPA